MPTKKELEQELRVYKANYNAQEKAMTHLLIENNRPFMDRVVEIESLLHDDVTRLVQTCIDTTGRVPEIHVEVDSPVKSVIRDHDHVTISLPIFEPDNNNSQVQGTAVKKLVEYCMNVGSWKNRNQCKDWIVGKIKESYC